jgi:ATP-binding cassette subfamily B protein
MYLNQLAPQLEKLSQAFNELLAEREFFKGTVEYIKGGYDNNDAQKSKLAITAETASIEFKNVSLQYEDTKNPAIQNLSFSIAPGKIVVITGESGAGKTSILSLLEKFYEPTHGEVLVAGTNIAEVSTESVRDAFAVVPQETLLLNISLRQNVAFANANATAEEIDNAIALAGLSDVLRKHGDDPIGVAGGKLSGGQRQRVAIARAYVRNAHILFLDEPTAALDAKKEQEIFSQLGELVTKTKRTAVIISHRLASLKYLPPIHKIIVLHQGKIFEEGTYDELMAKDGLFASQMRVTLAEEKLESIKRENLQTDNDIMVEEEFKPEGSIQQQSGLERFDTTLTIPEGNERDPLLQNNAPNPKNNQKKEEGWCLIL